MKWLLAGMLYVALAAAAFSQTHWAYADALWFTSFIAVCYAATMAFNARAERRAHAVGFLIGAVLFAVVIRFSESDPIEQLVSANGSGTPAAPPIYPPMIASGPTLPAASAPTLTLAPTPTLSGGGWRMNSPTQQVTITYNPNALIDVGARVRAANAIGLIVAGLMDSVLSIVTYRQSRTTPEPA